PGAPPSPGAGPGDPFSVTIQAQRDDGSPFNVVTATRVLLKAVITLESGVLRSTPPGQPIAGIIPAGQNTVTITGVTYNKAQTIQLLPTREGPGDPLRVIASDPITLHHGMYVNGTSGADANDCLTAGTACKTVGGAVGKAGANAHISIAAGVYSENLTISKSLTLAGESAATTILDGGQR
ncbi:MAG: hypothetical protein NTZ05_01175, partial [Chloroflexi bacterium]|nr:hypothetical protein [Chloroflexota bacterium]